MKDQVIAVKAKMLLRDCPEFIDRYIVLKNDGDSHYFFGHYSSRIDAENVAKQIKGEVVEKIHLEGANDPSESRMLYVFESGFAMDTYKPLEHELLKALVKEYGIVKTVKKENSV